MLSQLIFDIKTYLSVNYKNKKRFPNSTVLSYIPKNVAIGSQCNIRKGVYISSTIKSIGNGTYIGDGTEILNCEKIGNYCSISHDVKIGLDNHSLTGLSTSPLICKMEKNNATMIEHDVLISANVVVMSGVKLGIGSVVGANSFVNKDVPPYAIVAGSPAKLIRYRFDEQNIEKLLASKWWEKSFNSLKKLKGGFSDINLLLKNLNE